MMFCIFCASNATLTREHVLPRWIGTLPPGEGPFTIKRIAESGRTTEYKSRSADIVARVVCAACNGGWMSELETSAMPLLSPMINGEKQTVTAAGQHIVARWAVKTAIMFLYATQPPVGVSPEHRASLLEGRLPPNTGIWLARHQADRPMYNSWIRARVIEMRLPSQPQIIHVGHSVTLTLGHYVQQVLLTPPQWFGRAFTFIAPKALDAQVLQIPQGLMIRWPPRTAIAVDELQRHADAFGAAGIDTPNLGPNQIRGDRSAGR